MPELVIPASETLDNSQHTIYYDTKGPADSPHKLFLVMGLITDGGAWGYQVDYFAARGFQTVWYDNRGIGGSSYPKGKRCTTQAMATDALALADHLGWRQFHLCGVSMGGMISQEIALAAPERIVSLTLIVTHAGGWTAQAPIDGVYYLFKGLLFARNKESIIRAVMATLYSSKTTNPTTSDETARFERLYAHHEQRLAKRRQLDPLGAVGHFQAVLSHYISYPMLMQIRYSHFPVLVMVGSEDKLVRRQNSYMLHEVLGGQFHVIPDGGHGLLAEHPEIVNPILEKHFMNAANIRQSSNLTTSEQGARYAEHRHALSLGCRHRPHHLVAVMGSAVRGYGAGMLLRYLFAAYFVSPNQDQTLLQQAHNFGLVVGSVKGVWASLLCAYRGYRYRRAVAGIIKKYRESNPNSDLKDIWPTLALPERIAGISASQFLLTLGFLAILRRSRLTNQLLGR